MLEPITVRNSSTYPDAGWGTYPRVPREILEENHLIYSGGREIEPAYIGTSIVWYYDGAENAPIYYLFNGGTNRLVVLRLFNNEWSVIDPEDITNLYGFIWKMITLIKRRNER